MLSNLVKKPKKRTLADAERDIERLKKALSAEKALNQALMIEREFFVEQSRTLQNHTQTVYRLYASLFDRLSSMSVTESDIRENLEMAVKELRKPLATVEAVRVLMSARDDSTQGAYTKRDSLTQGVYTRSDD